MFHPLKAKALPDAKYVSFLYSLISDLEDLVRNIPAVAHFFKKGESGNKGSWDPKAAAEKISKLRKTIEISRAHTSEKLCSLRSVCYDLLSLVESGKIAESMTNRERKKEYSELVPAAGYHYVEAVSPLAEPYYRRAEREYNNCLIEMQAAEIIEKDRKISELEQQLAQLNSQEVIADGAEATTPPSLNTM